MKKMGVAFWAFLFSSLMVQAQPNVKEALQRMNQCIVAFSADNPRPLQLFQVSGTVEQAIEGRTQRIAMADMHQIQVSNSAAGYQVTLSCQSGLSCITLVKEDMSVMNMSETQFFFNNPAAANTFASSTKELIERLQKTPSPVSLTLFKTPDGKTPSLPATGSAPVATAPKANPTATPTPKANPLQTAGNNQADEEDDSPTPTKGSPSRTTPLAGQDDREPNEPVDLFCKQVLRVIQSGMKTNFNDLQGKMINAQQGSNESTLKLKGARRSYLSQFEGKRCFIAEMKSYVDNELAIEGLYDLQSMLEDCLGENWDNEDKTDDPAYDNVEFDAKDVELSDSNNPASPTVRLAIAPEGNKFILFIRIR